MASEPTNNYVPKVTGFYILRETLNDKTIESAVRTTLAVDRDFTDFDDLRTSINLELLDDQFGNRSYNPTSTNSFRGFPKPTVNMNYAVETFGSAPGPTYQALMCTPTINNKVGFDVSWTIQVECTPYIITNNQGIPEGEPNIQNITFTIAQGNTTVTSCTLDGGDQDEGAGKYRVNEIEPLDLGGGQLQGVQTFVFFNSSTVFLYYPTELINENLIYTAAQTIYPYNIEHYDGSGCSNPIGTGSFESVYSLKSASSLSNGDTVWLNAGLSTPPPNGWYIFWQSGLGDFTYGYVTNGTIGSFTGCEGAGF